MPDLQGQPAELRFTIEIKRAATGKVERFDLIGRVTGDECYALDSSTRRSD
jgi:hypothetical protein